MRRRQFVASVSTTVLTAIAGCIGKPNQEARDAYRRGLSQYQEGEGIANDTPPAGPDKEITQETAYQYMLSGDKFFSAVFSFEDAAEASNADPARQYALDASSRAREKSEEMWDLADNDVQKALSHQRAAYEYQIADMGDFKQATSGSLF
ncbi:hypothetical protein ACFQJC_15050 [Haloferax namakaokahaiae]|uniref:DUF4398 domain-containing protein n=1 Tax=Haloferax namakaokahaiae TaxID=1748331 RepID=A0ABD5ZI94_9EURY